MQTPMRKKLQWMIGLVLMVLGTLCTSTYAQDYEDVVVGPPLQYAAVGPMTSGELSMNACGQLQANLKWYFEYANTRSPNIVWSNPTFKPACGASTFELWVTYKHLWSNDPPKAQLFATDGRMATGCKEGTLNDTRTACIKRIYKDNSCKAGNPVSPGSGEKFHSDTDYQGAGAHPLDFQRIYRSNYKGQPSIANGWTHNWQRNIDVIAAATLVGSTATAQRPDGTHAAFKYSSAGWSVMTNGVFDTLTEVKTNGTRTGWQLKIWADDSVEHYDAAGALQKVVQRNDWTTTIAYSTATTLSTIAPFAGLPITITNHFGRKLELRYNNQGQLIALIDPAGGQIQYGYDGYMNLTKVTWQDNTFKQFVYAQPSTGRLTGVIDEMGVRIGTYVYDYAGRVISTEKTNGAEKLTLSYSAGKTIIGDITNNKTITHNLGTAQGIMRPTTISGASPLCGNTAAATTYDANGNVTQRTEHDGTITRMTYDAKNRETTRVEKSGTANALTYTTYWHGTFNLPALRAEPLKITGYMYDAKGNLTGQAESPTTDANGVKGPAGQRDPIKPLVSSGWSYDANSLPITSISQSSAYGQSTITLSQSQITYNALANPLTVKDQLSGVNAYGTSFDAHGNLLKGTRASGAIITQTFTQRGFWASNQVGNLLTTYTYDVRGLLISRKDFDGTLTQYIYDTSQRWIDTQITNPPTTAPRTITNPFGLDQSQRKALLALVPFKDAKAQAGAMRPLPIRPFPYTSSPAISIDLNLGGEPAKAPKKCDDKCKEILEKIEVRMADIRVRFVAMSVDKNNAYCNNQSGRLGWINHREKIQELQVSLKKLINEAQANGCVVNGEAYKLAALQPPICPGG